MQPERDVLWINAGGTIAAMPYPAPYTLDNPPLPVPMLSLKEGSRLIGDALRAIGAYDRVDGFNFLKGSERFYKDSTTYKPEDITALAEIIHNTHHKRILITHGTDCMAQHAAQIQEKLRDLGDTEKTVIFTGAFVPLAMDRSREGDGMANLSFAFEHMNDQPKGVYIVGINANTKRREFLNPAQVEKDMEASRKSLHLTFTPKER